MTFCRHHKSLCVFRVSGTGWTPWPARGGRWPAARYPLVCDQLIFFVGNQSINTQNFAIGMRSAEFCLPSYQFLPKAIHWSDRLGPLSNQSCPVRTNVIQRICVRTAFFRKTFTYEKNPQTASIRALSLPMKIILSKISPKSVWLFCREFQLGNTTYVPQSINNRFFA
jgi:hypothetical protein